MGCGGYTGRNALEDIGMDRDAVARPAATDNSFF